MYVDLSVKYTSFLFLFLVFYTGDVIKSNRAVLKELVIYDKWTTQQRTFSESFIENEEEKKRKERESLR